MEEQADQSAKQHLMSKTTLPDEWTGSGPAIMQAANQYLADGVCYISFAATGYVFEIHMLQCYTQIPSGTTPDHVVVAMHSPARTTYPFYLLQGLEAPHFMEGSISHKAEKLGIPFNQAAIVSLLLDQLAQAVTLVSIEQHTQYTEGATTNG